MEAEGQSVEQGAMGLEETRPSPLEVNALETAILSPTSSHKVSAPALESNTSPPPRHTCAPGWVQ